ncbi:MAG: MBL fold metallo-hydrolase [Synechococcales cyanobacterium M58_A2018_015]|nr:MBL fold metallo-hydrolase [Synechococcales cyanobacterium M58_A2018_015]
MPEIAAEKLPRPVFETIFAFPPNRATMGGTAYLIREETGNILVDCPPMTETSQQFIHDQGGVRWLFITQRGAIADVGELQATFNCQVLIQEQEAYLLPGLEVTRFQHQFQLSPTSEALWTCGYSPGSACLYHHSYGGVLFTGRHILPDAQGNPTPLRLAKTFHWRRQLQSIQALRDRFSAETLHYICPGANSGFLRGKRAIDHAYERLLQLDLEGQLPTNPLL